MNERSNFDHYVAQHFIKLFTNDSGVAYVGNVKTQNVEGYSQFDKILGKENWSVDQKIEDGFSKIEDSVAKALRAVKKDPMSIKGLSVNTAKAVRAFICMHYARSVGVHDAMNQSTSQLKSEFARTAPKNFDISTLGLRDATRPESLMFGINVADKIEVALMMKGCVALIAPNGQSFILGDNALANLSSRETFQFRGGLPNHDTYFWFPLTPKTGLIFIYKTGTILGEGSVKAVYASTKLVNLLNRSEVFLATQHIIGNSKGLIRGKVSLNNVGDERSRVTSLDWAPLTIIENRAVMQVQEEIINQIKDSVGPS
jgi:hypothetical protein